MPGPGNTVEQFYSDITQKTIDYGKNILSFFDINFEFVSTTCYPDIMNMRYHLKQSPLQITSPLSTQWGGSGTVPKVGNCISQHATAVIQVSDVIYDFDSETTTPRKLDLGYEMPYILKATMELKTTPTEYLLIPPLTKNLSFGMTDPEVGYLKKKLIKLDYMNPALINNQLNNFGSVTRQCVLDFQRKNGICKVCLDNGVVGPNTRNILNSK